MAVILTTKIFTVCPKLLGCIAGSTLTIDMVFEPTILDRLFGMLVLIAHQSKSGQRFIYNILVKSN